MWTDTHCHIHSEENPITLAHDAFEAGVEALICVGTDVETSHQAIGATAAINGARVDGDKFLPRTFCTVGLHPHDAANRAMAGVDGVEHLLRQHAGAKSREIVGVGECGLDYFYDNSPREEQKVAFRRQIELAKRFNLTLVIHTRDSWDDTFRILQEEGTPEKVLFHCFTGSEELAKKALDIGAFLSFSGMVTFKSAEEIRQAAKITPTDRLVIETDSPFLAPVPYRGRANVPAYVGLVGEFIAELRGASIDEFSNATNKAARECFSLDFA